MSKLWGRSVEVDSLDEFDRLAAAGARGMAGWRLQSLDLRSREDTLGRLDPAGAVLLGCRLTAASERRLRAGGALVFPGLPDVPFDPYRSALYRPAELYDGLATGGYAATLDARVYAWSRVRSPDVARQLARSLHDAAIDDALEESLAGRAAVGVMGGHALRRNSAEYAAAVRLGAGLARTGLYVVTGGGPGAMEAANLGAFVSERSEDVLEQAVAELASGPEFATSVDGWAAAGWAVRSRLGQGAASLGIPTWFYGHEPPNVFASEHAKYFQNALREDTLLRHCDRGIAFLPGAGGTVQEIFQDACENYYADEATVAPMVLVGHRYWTVDVPAWPLLQALARGRAMERAVHLVDSVADAVTLLTHSPPFDPPQALT